MTRILPLLLAGCVIGSDKYPRPRDLAPAWLVDRTRVLAVVAEPPEARPGDVVTFTSLIANPPGDAPDLGVAWFACPTDDDGNGFGCVVDFASVDLSDPDPAALADLGLIGFEPGLPPVYVVPDDLLADLAEEERLEGLYVVVQVTAFPAELLEDPLAEVDFAEVEAAYKRLVVSEAVTPNHNPPIGAFAVDGIVVPDLAVVHVEPEQVYDLSILLPDGARESYEYVTQDGEVEDRVEEPYVAWFVAGTDRGGEGDPGGEMFEAVTLWPYLEASWVAPAASGESGTWWAVLRDRRGGMAFRGQDWVVD